MGATKRAGDTQRNSSRNGKRDEREVWCVMARCASLGRSGSWRLSAGLQVAGQLRFRRVPAFEVASIKPNNSGGRGTAMGMQPGRYTATNVTLRNADRERVTASRVFSSRAAPAGLVPITSNIRRHNPG